MLNSNFGIAHDNFFYSDIRNRLFLKNQIYYCPQNKSKQLKISNKQTANGSFCHIGHIFEISKKQFTELLKILGTA